MKTSMLFTAALAALAITSCASVQNVRLSGVTGEKTYETAAEYTALEVSSAINVIYSQDAGSITVKADTTVLNRISVEEKGNILKIYIPWKENAGFINGNLGTVTAVVPASSRLECIDLGGASGFSSEFPVEAVDLTVDTHGASDFSAGLDVSGSLCLSASGASDIKSRLSAGKLTVKASGASDVKISGMADTYIISASGASSVSSGKEYVTAKTISCDISGASDAHAQCDGSASGSVSGASSFYVYGDGETNVSTSGASSLHRR